MKNLICNKINGSVLKLGSSFTVWIEMKMQIMKNYFLFYLAKIMGQMSENSHNDLDNLLLNGSFLGNETNKTGFYTGK